ncbi:LysM domain-containing protein [bacterium]|nr:LysM domain-containing protein [bacterium]
MVQKGESLWSISEKYNVTVQSIFKWNTLKKSRIFPGNKLKILIPKLEKG